MGEEHSARVSAVLSVLVRREYDERRHEVLPRWIDMTATSADAIELLRLGYDQAAPRDGLRREG